MSRLLTILILTSILSVPTIASADRLVRVRPGAEGKDVAAYTFFPSLARGNYDTLYAFSADDENGLEHRMQTFLEFPVGPGLLGPNETIKLAELRVFYAFDFDQFGNSNDEPGTMSCHPVTQAWNETAVTWNSRPAFGAPIQTLSGINALGVLRFNITSLALGWATGAVANHGVALTSESERVLGFYSFEKTGVEDDFRPNLVIVIGPSGILDADSDGVADDTDNCPAVANALQEDADGDGAGDACDNCTQAPNADQRDTNGDGYGNACDPDFNGDEIVNFLDLSTLKQRFFTTDADADLNGDGLVNFLDLSRFKQWFLSSPGPSAVAP